MIQILMSRNHGEEEEGDLCKVLRISACFFSPSRTAVSAPGSEGRHGEGRGCINLEVEKDL